VRSNDGIDRAGISTMRATDAQCLVDDGDGRRDGFCERNNIPAEQVGQSSHCLLTPWRAEVNGRLTLNHSSGVWPTTRIAALRALRLWKKIIDLLHDIAVA
jgi:hypothetical protein